MRFLTLKLGSVMEKRGDVCWELERVRALSRLEEHTQMGLIDDELLEFLWLLNENPHIVTTSSCSGRISILCGGDYWDKREANLLVKSHSPISVYSVASALMKGKFCKNLWIKATHPILDLKVQDLKRALDIVRIAVKAGFKYSGVQDTPCGYRVIVKSSDSLQVPLNYLVRMLRQGVRGEALRELAIITAEMNKYLLEGKVRLARLFSLMMENNLIM